MFRRQMARDDIVCGERGDERELGGGAGAYAKPQPEGRVEIAFRRVPAPAAAPAPLGLLIRRRSRAVPWHPSQAAAAPRSLVESRLSKCRTFAAADACRGAPQKSEREATSAAALSVLGARTNRITKIAERPSVNCTDAGDWVEGCALLVEVHDLDDAQIIIGAHDRQHRAHDGEPSEVGLDRGVEHVELGEEAGQRRHARQREQQHREQEGEQRLLRYAGQM